jgi:DNA-binding CsgD family transcriptional regulator
LILIVADQDLMLSTFENILYSAVDGVFAVDAKQRIIFWNPGCEELFDRSSQWVLGRPCNDVVCGRTLSSGAMFCRPNCRVARLSSGGDGPNRFSIQTNDGNNRPLRFSVEIMLVPSRCNLKWIVLHLLHRQVNQDLLSAMDNAPRPGKQVSLAARSAIGDCARHQSRLTARETEVLQLLAEGLSSTVISKRFTVSRTTVRNHIQHIQSKLGVHSQTEAVAYAYRHNIVM